MRKTFLILSLLGITLMVCADATARERRFRNRRYYYDDSSYYYAPGYNYGDGASPAEVRRSFYSDPALQESARIMVLLPNQDAEVWFDDSPTKQRGMERMFDTPALAKESAYTIKARWTENGKSIDRERRIQVGPGQVVTIDLRAKSPEKLPPLRTPRETPRESETSTPIQNATPSQTGRDDEKMPLLKLDGTWTAVYVEMDGKKVDNKDFTNVTIKNNVVTCRHNGKEKTFRMEFGPHHMIRCTQQSGDNAITEPTEQRVAHTHHGVYVASHDYFCVSLNKGMDRRFGGSAGARDDGKGREAQPTAPERWEGHGPYGAGMVIILRRAGTASAASR
jgi:uncharacterized protein (TIGR03000 family)